VCFPAANNTILNEDFIATKDCRMASKNYTINFLDNQLQAARTCPTRLTIAGKKFEGDLIYAKVRVIDDKQQRFAGLLGSDVLSQYSSVKIDFVNHVLEFTY
jgi:hypothetical protein